MKDKITVRPIAGTRPRGKTYKELKLTSSPIKFSNFSALTLSDFGSIRISDIFPSFNWITFVFAYGEISSKPSSLFT